MRPRARGLVVLIAFLLGTGFQSFLHGHLEDGRHHEEGCEHELAAAHHAHPTAAHRCSLSPRPADPEVPGSGTHHAACAPCASPAADLRAATGTLGAPTLAVVAPSVGGATFVCAAPRLGYDLRGPPLA